MDILNAVCFGEVLWDIFPDSERIGGAPLNGASRLSSMGITTKMISKTGEDKAGKDIVSYLQSNGVGTEHVIPDASYPTGKVNVTLSKNRSATYEIPYPSAWDKIELSDKMIAEVEQADAFIFGSLVCRDKISRRTLFDLLSKAAFKIFDLNLRPPHYDIRILTKLMKQSDFLKFNDDELFEISAKLGSPYNSLEQNLNYIAEKTSSQSVCVTKGSHGAVLLKDNRLYYNSGFKIRVKDTVGAGDSFLASLIAKLLQKEETQKALDYACAVGALVAGEEGANPQLKVERIENFMFPK